MPRKYACKIDANQPEIVRALRGVGASVLHLHTVGGGCPDIAVGYQCRNYLFEIKDGALPPSARQLTTAEAEFVDGWKGTVHTVKSVDEALALIGCTPIPFRGTIND